MCKKPQIPPVLPLPPKSPLLNACAWHHSRQFFQIGDVFGRATTKQKPPPHRPEKARKQANPAFRELTATADFAGGGRVSVTCVSPARRLHRACSPLATTIPVLVNTRIRSSGRLFCQIREAMLEEALPPISGVVLVALISSGQRGLAGHSGKPLQPKLSRAPATGH